jgi:hypothetical protein
VHAVVGFVRQDTTDASCSPDSTGPFLALVPENETLVAGVSARNLQRIEMLRDAPAELKAIKRLVSLLRSTYGKS